MRWVGIGLLAGTMCLSGCASKYVNAVVKNESGESVSLVEVDYPSASFGTEALAAGGVYNYRFKILGSGPTKVTWTDAARHEHTATGPNLDEGQQGQLIVTVTPQDARWETHLNR